MSAVDDILAQARAAAEPSAEARARVGSALKNALANPPVTDPSWASPAAHAPFWGGSLGSYVTVGIIAAGLGLGAGWGASRAVAAQSEPAHTETAAPRVQLPPPEPESPKLSHELNSTALPDAGSLKENDGHASQKAPRSAPPPRGEIEKPSTNVAAPSNEANTKDPLLFVVAGLQRAQTELKNGHPLQALLLLDELDKNYPSEVLLEERSAVRVHVQCAASRSPSSVVAARTFMRAHPASLYVERIRQACGIE